MGLASLQIASVRPSALVVSPARGFTGFSFPLIACGHYKFGEITATVSQAPLHEVVATKTVEVMVAPEPPPMEISSYLHDDECYLGTPLGTRGAAGGWMEDGGAYSVGTTIYLGIPPSSIALGILWANADQFCMVGAVEKSASSRAEGDGLHTIVLTKTQADGAIGQTQSISVEWVCTCREGLCGNRNIHQQLHSLQAFGR